MLQFLKKIWEQYKLLAIIIGLILAFALGVYLSKFVDRRLGILVNEQLVLLREKSKISIAIGKIETQFGSVRLSEVSIGHTGWLVVDKIDVGISFNPFSDFLKPRDLKIGQAVVKIPWERAQWPEEIDLIIDFIKTRQSQEGDSGDSQGRSRLSAMLPHKLSVEAARVELADLTTTKFLAERLYLSADLKEKSLSYKMGQLQILTQVQEAFLEGDIKLSSADSIFASAVQKENFAGDPNWTIGCDIHRRTWQISCTSQSRHLPLSLSRMAQRTLGSGFSPGFNGTVKLNPLLPASEKNFTDQKDGLAPKKLKDSAKKLSFPIQWTVQVDGQFENMYVEHNTLAVVPVGPIGFKTNILAGVDLKAKRLLVKAAEIEMLPVQSTEKLKAGSNKAERSQNEVVTAVLDVDVTLARNSEGKRFLNGNIQVDVHPVSCAAVYQAIPKSFIPELDHMILDGTLEVHGTGTFSDGSSDFSIRNSKFHCSVVNTPEIYSAGYLSGAFVIERETPQGVVRIPVDPNRPYFAAYSDIPHLVRMAFVTSEDTGFYHHKGVEMGAIIGAAEKNTQVGRAAVGGSTITMQTVKNLFLARDKTLSRKFQEMFLAWHLENVVSKERILEIYLNMVEFGPGLYGIGRASQRFFGKEAKELTLKESIYLASLLPAPVPRYRYFCKGEVTQNYNKILNQLLDRMLMLGKISMDQHERAKNEVLNFSEIEREGACSSTSVTETESDLTKEETRE